MAIAIVLVYIVRLFTLQLMSDDYRKSADSNAFRKEIIYPSRGLITDRHGTLLVYNEPSYNILVTMQDQRGVDTLDFCRTVASLARSTSHAWPKSKTPKRMWVILATRRSSS